MQHCLVIDDEEINRDILNKQLTSMGYKVDVMNSAAKALDHCKHNSPIFIMLDYHMDGLDGLGFLKALRKFDPEALIPVIMCTGEDRVDHFEELRVQGISGYLLKPFKPEDLRKQLKALNLYPPPDRVIG